MKTDDKTGTFVHMDGDYSPGKHHDPHALANRFSDGTITIGPEGLKKVDSEYLKKGMIVFYDMPVSFFEDLNLKAKAHLNATDINDYKNVDWRMQNVTNMDSIVLKLTDKNGKVVESELPMKDNTFKTYIEMTDENNKTASFVLVDREGNDVDETLYNANDLKVEERRRWLKVISGQFTPEMKANVENSVIGNGICDEEGKFAPMTVRNVKSVSDVIEKDGLDGLNTETVNLDDIRAYYNSLDYKNKVHFNSYKTYLVKENYEFPDGSKQDIVITLDNIFNANCNGCLVYALSSVTMANTATVQLNKTTQGYTGEAPEKSVEVSITGTDNDIKQNATIEIGENGSGSFTVELPLSGDKANFNISETSSSNDAKSKKTASVELKKQNIISGVSDYSIWVGKVDGAGEYVASPAVNLVNDYSVTITYKVRPGDEAGVKSSIDSASVDLNSAIGENNVSETTLSDGWFLDGYYIDGKKVTPEEIAALVATGNVEVEIRVFPDKIGNTIPGNPNDKNNDINEPDGVDDRTQAIVTFVDEDGTVLNKQVVDLGDDAKAPVDPSQPNKTFTGWDKTFTNIQEDLTVTAQYKAPEDPVAPESPAAPVVSQPQPQQAASQPAATQSLASEPIVSTGDDFSISTYVLLMLGVLGLIIGINRIRSAMK